jgi:hypothetical protein
MLRRTRRMKRRTVEMQMMTISSVLRKVLKIVFEVDIDDI